MRRQWVHIVIILLTIAALGAALQYTKAPPPPAPPSPPNPGQPITLQGISLGMSRSQVEHLYGQPFNVVSASDQVFVYRRREGGANDRGGDTAMQSGDIMVIYGWGSVTSIWGGRQLERAGKTVFEYGSSVESVLSGLGPPDEKQRRKVRGVELPVWLYKEVGLYVTLDDQGRTVVGLALIRSSFRIPSTPSGHPTSGAGPQS